MGVLVAAALAGCSAGKPEAGSLQSTPISSQSAATTATPSSPASTSASARPSSSTGTSSPKASTGPTVAGSSSAGSGGSGSSTSWACVTTALRAACPTVTYPSIQGTYQDPNVSNDIWNPISGWHQTLYANNPGDWNVVATGPAGNTAVVSYPSSDAPYAETPLTSFHALYSSFSENMHAQGGTSAEAAYDIWLNNWNNEVMVQHDIVNRGSCSTLATVDFGGSNGVPVRAWNLCTYGTEIIWQLSGGQEQSGSVDILAMLDWLVNHKYLPQKDTMTAIGYGFEICSTGGKPENFTVNGLSITT
jgi:hypothetical protein